MSKKRENYVLKQSSRAYAVPYIGWMLAAIVAPMLVVVFFAFTADSHAQNNTFTLEHFARFFSDAGYLKVLLNSLYLAFLTTVICLLIGYPVGLIMADRKLSLPKVILFFIIIPMWMNFLLRTYAWMVLLEDTGLINTLLTSLGLPKAQLMYNNTGVLIGLVYNYLPFMILPIYSALNKMDNSLIEASMDLGASPLQVFRRVTLPLSLPGVISGVTMVFMPAVSTFAVSRLLGGSMVQMVGDMIEAQFKTDQNFASAISLVMMVLILLTMWLANRTNPQTAAAKEVRK